LTLANQLDDDMDLFFDLEDFGETATYSPIGGTPFDIVVLPSFQNNLTTTFSSPGAGQFRDAWFDVRADAVTPKHYDKIIHKTIEWTVRDTKPMYDGRVLRVMVTTDERANL